jgi:hypothetical protein
MYQPVYVQTEIANFCFGLLPQHLQPVAQQQQLYLQQQQLYLQRRLQPCGLLLQLSFRYQQQLLLLLLRQ